MVTKGGGKSMQMREGETPELSHAAPLSGSPQKQTQEQEFGLKWFLWEVQSGLGR